MRISVAIMHHPARAQRLPALVDACRPLVPRVVLDPDPTGPSSPLRTAKRAWAQIEDGATHHLVLQDDAALTPGFAGHLTDALSRRPEHGVTLYSHWNSPQNSYLVRRAAVAGSAWAPLSSAEWTPTQGFVLPVALARELAAYLEPIPDHVRDDDEMIALFCASRGVPVVATVPHLVDHAAGPTLADHPGAFHATVLAAGRPLPPEHWRVDERTLGELADRAGFRDPGAHVVEFVRSRCQLKFIRPGSGEPVEHYYGWHWRDWCHLAGFDGARVLAGLDTARAPAVLPPETSAELWAAGYLLGADAATIPPGAAGARDDLVRAAVGSWIDSGLCPSDRSRLGPGAREALADLGVTAVEQGLRHRHSGRGRAHVRA
ncbi:hypothetical protein [Actinomadura harenae]|uniref:Uncharacterized protein n=1 Tax=Actinomadura harenae TaxID=2483351 RepID=A0A3M2LPU7_9ACTN|nr:hypothetical protein [Actinomadura harenae]RMI38563.1 hypothetical protein EBO15_32440 [Actinomadura harenae]